MDYKEDNEFLKDKLDEAYCLLKEVHNFLWDIDHNDTKLYKEIGEYLKIKEI